MDGRLSTVILLSLLTALVLFLGSLFGAIGLIFALVFVVLFNVVMYWYGDTLVLKMYRAQPLDKKAHARVYAMTEKLCRKAGTPIPKLYYLPTLTPNAFATGRNRTHSAMAFTQGILELLNDEELEGVIGHELSHILHYDMLISTIAGIMAGLIAYAASMLRWGLIFGRHDDNRGNLAGLIVIAVVAPLAATIIQLAISRSREYLADAGAVRLTGKKDAMIHALEKIHKGVHQRPMQTGSAATSSMFIANPFRASTLVNLLSTHPPMQKRITALQKL